MTESQHKARLDEIDAALVRLYAQRRPVTRAIRAGASKADELAVIDRQIDDLELEGERLRRDNGMKDAADSGRRSRVADLAWRLRLWADDAERSGSEGEAHAYRKSADEVERMGSLCWLGFDVERDRHPAPMIR